MCMGDSEVIDRESPKLRVPCRGFVEGKWKSTEESVEMTSYLSNTETINSFGSLITCQIHHACMHASPSIIVTKDRTHIYKENHSK
jgi:hypothetical protein